MSREIKFRAWDKQSKGLYPVSLIDWDLKRVWLEGSTKKATNYGWGWQDFDKVILMQFTGLRDKNDKEIYGEGDIYKDANEIISIVKMAVDGWALFPVKKGTPVRNLYWQNICNSTKGEVIGNIHDNPELLEGKVK